MAKNKNKGVFVLDTNDTIKSLKANDILLIDQEIQSRQKTSAQGDIFPAIPQVPKMQIPNDK
jgi:hypothetical protein